jgi:hypothetical protein
MKKIASLIQSVILMTLFWFFSVSNTWAFPYLKTIYTIPENEFDFTLKEEYHSLDESYRIEGFRMGFAVLQGVSLWFSSSYLHSGDLDSGRSEIGDSHITLKFQAGDYFREKLHAALLVEFRIPTGKDSYTVSEWKGVSFGNNELIIGPVFQIDPGSSFFVHLNLLYIFSQGEGEGFYDGFRLNLSDRSSYKKALGFNYTEEGAFFYRDKLKNDYIRISAGINSDGLYPLIPFISLHYYYGFNGNLPEHIPCGGGSFFLSAGSRYFFTGSSFAGIYGALNPANNEKTYYIAGIDAGILF